MNFKGKKAIITGAAKGIGRGCAEFLGRRGASVLIADFDYERATATVNDLIAEGIDAAAVCVNVKNVSDLEKMVEFAVEKFGGIDILINNAGIMQTTEIEDMTEEEWDNILAINLKSVFFAVQKVLPYMKEKGGRIVNLSSLAGRNGGYTNGLGYSATKAGIIGLTRGMASRLAKYGITVNAVAPGSTDTGILDCVSEEKIKQLVSKIPLGRFGKIEEIASAIGYLCTDEAAFITGAVLDANGGIYMG
ncbi:MAG: SDR family oxidoreductase [Oscillospiraceae bacterium]|nr:SDR family oxidoreductase [Oscillospiraceae bacterium]